MVLHSLVIVVIINHFHEHNHDKLPFPTHADMPSGTTESLGRIYIYFGGILSFTEIITFMGGLRWVAKPRVFIWNVCKSVENWSPPRMSGEVMDFVFWVNQRYAKETSKHAAPHENSWISPCCQFDKHPISWLVTILSSRLGNILYLCVYTAARNLIFQKSFHTRYTCQHLVENMMFIASY